MGKKRKLNQNDDEDPTSPPPSQFDSVGERQEKIKENASINSVKTGSLSKSKEIDLEIDRKCIGYRCELEDFQDFAKHMHDLLDTCLNRVRDYRTKEGFWKPPKKDLKEKVS